MFDLKKQGRNVTTLHVILSRQQNTSRERSSRLTSLGTARAHVLDAARYRTGAFEIERLILALKLKRDNFVKSFDDPTVAAARFSAYVGKIGLMNTAADLYKAQKLFLVCRLH